jgi:hypothetical protein
MVGGVFLANFPFFYRPHSLWEALIFSFFPQFDFLQKEANG